MVMTLGIGQKNLIDGNGCFYTLQSNDQRNNPAAGYYQIPEGCRTSFAIGLLIALNAIVAVFALWQFDSKTTAIIVQADEISAEDKNKDKDIILNNVFDST